MGCLLEKLRSWLTGDGEARDARYNVRTQRERDRQTASLLRAVEREVANGATVHVEREMIDVTMGAMVCYDEDGNAIGGYRGDDYRQYQPGAVSTEVIRPDGTRLLNFGYELKEV